MNHLYSRRLTSLPLRFFIPLILFFFTFSANAQVPTITHFAPAAATANSSVVITGTNFNATASSNIVHFGSIRATVTAATTTSLTVVVPVNAPNQPIKVTVAGKTVASRSSFRLLFPSPQPITASTFLPGNNYTLSGNGNQHRATWGDLDGDGYVEFICPSNNSTGIYVARNTSTSGTISFATVQTLAVTGAIHTAMLGDFDGDGLPEVIGGASGTSLYILRNTSTPGNISFAAAQSFTCNDSYGLGVADMNNDGLNDLVVANYSSNSFKVYRNTSTGPGVISFVGSADFACSFSPWELIVNDFDRDGVQDVAVGAFSTSLASVYRNTTPAASATISFGAAQSLSGMVISSHSTLQSNDLNGDSLPEIVLGSANTTLYVYQNLSTPGSIAFGTSLGLTLNGSVGRAVAIEDINGDGYNDLITMGDLGVNIYPNTGSTGTITASSFLSRIDFNSGATSCFFGYVADIDRDGRKDLAFNQTGTSSYFLRRFDFNCPSPAIITQPQPIATCTGVSASFSIAASGNGTVTYQWRKNGVNISGATSSTYTIPSVVAGDAGNYSCVISDSCVVFNSATATTSANAVLTISAVPVITTHPTSVAACGGLVSLTSSATGNGSLTYQWFKNGSAIPGAVSNILSLNNTTILDTGRYNAVISSALCSSSISTDTATITFTSISAPVVANGTLCNPFSNLVLTNTLTAPATHVTKWYDDAALTSLLATGNSLSRLYSGQDTVYVRNESNPNILSGVYAVDNNTLAGDDRSAIAVTKNYYYYVGDNFTVRYNMPGLTSGVSYPIRDGLVSTYGGNGTLYSLGTITAPWGTFGTSATHIWKLDSTLTAIPGSAVAFTGVTTISTNSGTSFLAGTDSFVLYKSGTALFKIDPVTGLVTTLSSNLTNFSPAASEGWSAWGFAEVVNGNHYIYYRSSVVTTGGIVKYHVEGNSNTVVFDPGATAVLGDMAAIANAPWYNRWYFKMETGTAATTSTGFLEVSAYCDAPMRFSTVSCPSAIDTVIIVSTIPVISAQPQPAVACSGGFATFTVATSVGANLTYQWRKNNINIPGATNDTLVLNSILLADSGDYTVNISNGCISVLSNAARLSTSGINILTQPTNSFNCAGEPVMLFTSAIGTGTLTYQWRKNNVNIPGATNDTLIIPVLTPADTGNYTVQIIDNCALPVTSAIARVYISTGPVISSITPNSSVCASNDLTLSVSASGSGTIAYQWRLNGNPITGATSSSYTIVSATAAAMGNYTVTLSDNCGQTISGNIAVSLTVITAPTVNNTTFCTNTNINLTNNAAAPSGFITRWYDDAALTITLGSGPSMSKFYSQTDTVYARNEPNSTLVSGVGTVDHNSLTGDDRGGIAAIRDYFYYVGDNNTVRYRMPGLTNGTSLNVRDGIVSTYGGNGVLYSFGNITAPFGTWGSSITHLWQLDSNLNAVAGSSVALSASLTAVSGSFVAGGEDFILFKNNLAIYKIDPVTGVVTTLSTTFTNFAYYGSENWASWGFAEIVNGNHYIYYREGSTTFGIHKYHVESNTTSVVFGFSSPLSDMACIVNAPWYTRWYFHFEGGSVETGSSGFSETAGYCDAPMRWQGTGCNSNIDTIFVVKNVVTILNQPQSTVSCTGTQTRFTVSATGTALSYQWRKNNIAIPGATDDTLTISSTLYSDSGNYTVAITSSCGQVISSVASLTVRGVRITAQPAGVRVCGGEPASLSVTATGNGTLFYQWARNSVNIPSANNSTYNIAALIPDDTGSYTVTISDSCGSPVTSSVAVVTMSTGPSVTSLSSGQVVCGGTTASIGVVAVYNGFITYQWRRNGTNINGATSSTLNVNNFTAADTGNYTVVMNDLCGQTISAAVQLSLFTPVMPAVNNSSVCFAGATINLTNTISTPSGYTTKWYDNGALTVLLGSGSSLSRVINGTDSFFVRNEANIGTCVSRVDTVVITVNPSNTWTGATNTNWFNASNWSCGIIPNSTSSAIIPSGPVNMPVINSGLTGNVLDITISSGASLSILGTGTLNVYGQLTRTGTLSCPTGTINFNNTTSMILIPGGSYYNVSVTANSNGAKLTGSMFLGNAFTFTGNCIVRLDTCNLTQYNYMSTAVTGAGLSSYFATNSTGRLRFAGIGTGATNGNAGFAYTGNSTYNPISITNAGTADTLTIGVIDSVCSAYTGITPSGVKLTSNVVNRIWVIQETTSGGSNLTLVPGWVTGNETSGFTRTSCYLAQYGTNSWTSGNSGAAVLTGSNYYKSQTGYTTTGVFGVGSNNALPVELLSFNATRQNNHVQVEWITASETNNRYFEPEVSADGKTFITLTRVAGKGNSNQVNRYSQHHFNAVEFASHNQAPTLYYRLKQVDFSGEVTYSIAVPVHIKAQLFQASVSPNPYTSETSVRVTTPVATKAQISISDANGKQVSDFTHMLSEGDNHIDLSGAGSLASGIYFVTITTESGELKTFKIVKQ